MYVCNYVGYKISEFYSIDFRLTVLRLLDVSASGGRTERGEAVSEYIPPHQKKNNVRPIFP